MNRSRTFFTALLFAVLGVTSLRAGMSIAPASSAPGWCYVFYGLGTPAPGKIAYIKVTRPDNVTYTAAQAENVSDYSQTAYVWADIPGNYTFYYEYSFTSQGVPRTTVSQQTFYIQPRPRDIRWDSVSAPSVGAPYQSVAIQPYFTNTGGYNYGSDYFIEYKDTNQTPIYYASINGVVQNASSTVSVSTQLPNIGGIGTATYHLRALQNNVTYFGNVRDVPIVIDYAPSTSLSVSSSTAMVNGPAVNITSYSSDAYANLINQAIDYLAPGSGSWVSGTGGAGTRWDGGPTSSNNLVAAFTFNAQGTWQFRARAQDSYGQLSAFQYQNVTVSPAAPPGAPTVLSATSITSSSFTANWTSVSTANGYRLDVSTNSGFSSFVPGYQDLDVGNVTTRSVTGLSASTTYYYRVRAYNSGGTGSGSGTASLTTLAPPPGVPTATAATGATTTGFTANWTSSSGATSYRLDVSLSSGFGSFVSGYQDLDVGAVVSRAVTGLSPGTTYYYRVRAYSTTGGASASSNTVTATTNAVPPGAPTAYAASGITTNGLTANWSGVSGATGYQLDVSLSSSFTTYVSGYQNLSVGNVTNRSVTGLTSGVTYYYRVRATNSAGASGNSNTVAATTTTGPVNGNGPGLRGDYYSGTNFDSYNYTNNGENVDNDWGDNGDEYSIRWTGRVMPRYSENYTFITTSDDGVRLWIDDQLVIDNWTDHGSTDDYSTVTLSLTAGVLYNVKMEFFENGGDAVAKLGWQSNSQGRESIPTQQLYLPGAAQTAVTSQNATATVGVPWSPLDIPGGAGYAGGSGSGRWEFVIASVNNWGVNPWTPPATGTYYFYVMKRGDPTYDQAVSTVYYSLTVVQPLGTPTASAATNVTTSSFTANWTAVSGAASYKVDVATDSGFTAYVSGYQDVSAGATTSLTVTGLTSGATYYYRVRAYNSPVTSADSNVITVTVTAVAPTITQHPQSQGVAIGGSVTLGVTATGSTPFTYQWRKGGTPLGGATNSTYSIASAQVGDAGSYDVIVTNAAGSATSSPANLTVGSSQPDTNNVNLLNIHIP